jgi:ankyrin repeat protein
MRLKDSLALAIAIGFLALSGIARGAEQDLSVNARLLLAARNGDAAGLERALKGGAAANSRNRLGETALLIALKKGDLAMAKVMLDAGTDVNLPAVNGVTPLMAAAFAGQAEMVATLSAAQPVGRMGTPREVADLALYLASDEAGFATATDYPLDGGFLRLHG